MRVLMYDRLSLPALARLSDPRSSGGRNLIFTPSQRSWFNGTSQHFEISYLAGLAIELDV